jgi:hypothetical protein
MTIKLAYFCAAFLAGYFEFGVSTNHSPLLRSRDIVHPYYTSPNTTVLMNGAWLGGRGRIYRVYLRFSTNKKRASTHLKTTKGRGRGIT